MSIESSNVEQSIVSLEGIVKRKSPALIKKKCWMKVPYRLISRGFIMTPFGEAQSKATRVYAQSEQYQTRRIMQNLEPLNP